jgi:hypothetical protein
VEEKKPLLEDEIDSTTWRKRIRSSDAKALMDHPPAGIFSDLR